MFILKTQEKEILLLSDGEGRYRVLEKERVDNIIYEDLEQLLAANYFGSKSLLETLPDITEFRKTICA